MNKLLGTIAIVAAIAAIGAAPASAATEFGDSCTANGGAENYTFVPLQATGDPLPLTAPSGGVITQWKQNVGFPSPPPVTIRETLLVLHPTASPLQFTVAGRSAESAPIVNGQNSFPTRIPVQAGDRLGLTGGIAPLYCQTAAAGDAMGVVMSPNPAQGSTLTVESLPEFRVPAMAVIEPDADGDGYGDETQDKCPQSAAFQTECPLVTLDEFALAGNGAITALVISNYETKVTVSASTKSGKAAKRHALKGAAVTLKPVTKKVVPGKLSKFKLPFTKQLRSALAALPPGKSLKLHVTASAKNVVGQVSKVSKTVKVK